MISSSLQGSAPSQNSSCVKRSSGSNPVTSTFAPFGRYVDVGSQEIKSPHPGLPLHVGSTSTLYLNKGTLLGNDITYLSQVWNIWDAESTQEFYEQVLPYIHPKTLRPLMGICAPTVIGLYSAAGGRVSLAMELPHPVGWREADPYISPELKEKVIVAYQNIHGRNILHNDIKLENLLIGDDDEVTIVDFCKMVIDSEPADLALEMRVVKFILDYDGAKKAEYERLRRADSRVERNLRKSRLRRKIKNKEPDDEVEPDEPPSQEEIDFPPFSRRCLMKWDSEVVSEGTTHCPGWRGRRFEIPEDMQNPPWPGIKDYILPTLPPYQPIDFAGLVKRAFGRESFSSHSQWMKHCHYFSCLWSLPESAVPDHKQSVGTSSSLTSSGSSYYGSRSERGSTSDSEPPKRYRSPAPPSPRKRTRTEDFTRPDDYPHGNKRVRRSKSLEILAGHEVDPASWTTFRVRELDSPLSLSKSKGKGRESPPSFMPSRESSPSEADLPTLADLSPYPRGPDGRATRRSTTKYSRGRASASTDPRRPLPVRSPPSAGRTLVTASPRDYHPRRKSERNCSVVVKDGDEGDKIWFMSKEALQDVEGYLQVKKAAGAAIEVRSGGEEDDVRRSHLRIERTPRSSSTRPKRKRTISPEDNSEEVQKPKQRRSWPGVDPYVSKPRIGSLPCSG